MKLIHTSAPHIDVKFRVKCNGNWTDSASCSNITIGEKIYFEAIVTPRDCQGPETFTIKAEGISEEIQIELNTICQCECELSGPQELNAEACGGRGNLTCGLCSCNEGFSGRNCECSSTNSKDHVDASECVDPSTNMTCAGMYIFNKLT